MKRIHLWIYSMAILAMTDVLLANPILTLNQRLTETETLVNTQALTVGDAEIASRISDAVFVDAGALSAQRARLDAEWGELLIAHEVARISRTTQDPFRLRNPLTVDQVVQLRSEGLSWNQILSRYRISPARLSRALDTSAGTLRVGGSLGVSEGADGSSGTDGTNVTNGTDSKSGSVHRAPTRTASTGSRDRGDGGFTNARVSKGAAVGIERNLEASVQRLEADAERRGDGAVADRLASELGVSSDLLREQRDAFDADWGELLIAYTLVEQSRSGAGVGRIFDMRDGGMSWFQIAKSLRVPPGRLMNLVRRGTADVSGTRIASGKAVAKTGARTTKALARGNGVARGQGGAALKAAGRSTQAGRAAAVGGGARIAGSTGAMKLGGGSVSTMRPVPRMGGGIGGGSATRIPGAAGRGHGRR